MGPTTKSGPRRDNDRPHGIRSVVQMQAERTPQQRLYRELVRAPIGGLTRGELAILLLDLDDDTVSAALHAEVVAGRVLSSERQGLVRYHPCNNGTQP